MSPANEAELIEKAKAGDRQAFAALYEPVERPLGAFLYRLTASRADAADLAQDTAVRALETIGEFGQAASFRAWVFEIAARGGLEYLRTRRRWDPDAQFRAGARAGEGTRARGQMQQLHKSRLHTTYEIREHIDFCFMVMGRTLPPHEQAALLLVEVHGFSLQEAGETMGASPQVLELRVQQARQALIEHFDTRCGLINKDGVCTQCAGLDTLLYKDRRHTEQALFQIPLEPRATPAERAATWPERLALVRSIDPLYAQGARFHELLATLLRKANGYD